MADQDLARAFGAATSAARVAGVPFADVGGGLARLFSNPSSEGAAQFAGQTMTNPSVWMAALRAAENGLPSLADLGGSLANVGANAANFVSGLPGSAVTAAANLAGALPALGAGAVMGMFQGGGPLKLLLSDAEPGERVVKRFKRTRDAANTEHDVWGPLTKPGAGIDTLATPVQGSTIGDALASVLRYSGDGTWYTDTAHGWRPDPYLYPAQEGLRRLGYLGDSEPRIRDMGGVGEMVMGGSNVAPWEQPFQSDVRVNDEGGSSTTYNQPDYRTGPRGWNAGLRRLFGVSDAPNPWDFDRPVTTQTGTEPGTYNPTPSPAADYQAYSQAAGTGAQATLTDPSNQYVQYLDALPGDVSQRMRDFETKKAQQRDAVAAMATNMGG